jgi:hypothetical protein
MTDKLARPVGGESPTAFLDVLGKGEKAMLKKSTGFPRYEAGDLPKVLNPEQMAAVDAVKASIERKAAFDRMASEGRTAAMEAARMEVPKVPPTGMFHPGLSVARSAVNRVLGGLDRATMNYLVDNMDNPAKIAQLMRKATPKQRAAINAFAVKYGAPLAPNSQEQKE